MAAAPYAQYVPSVCERWSILFLLLAIFILNQADRQLLPVLISGGLKCSEDDDGSQKVNAILSNATTSTPHYKEFDDCIRFSSTLEGLLKGPTFAVMYGVFGVILGFLGDRQYRNKVLAFATLFWSLTTAAIYFVENYWELFALRLLLGIGEAVFNPIAYAVIAGLFKGPKRATALAVYHSGVYLGGGTGYVAGAIQESIGWRKTFVVFGAPGVLLSLIFLLAVPDRKTWNVGEPTATNTTPQDQQPLMQPDDPSRPKPTLFSVFKEKERLSLFLLLCAAAAVRQIAGYSLGAYYPTFYRDQFNLDHDEYGHTMLLLGIIVMTAGTAGSLLGEGKQTVSLVIVLGGVVTDKFSSASVAAKLSIIGITQLICAPILFGLFLLKSLDTAYGLQTLIYLIGESWLGLAACSLQDMIMPHLRSQASALYIMINTVIGGCGPLIVGAMLDISFFKNSSVPIAKCLLYLIPSAYVLSFILFIITALRSRSLKTQYLND